MHMPQVLILGSGYAGLRCAHDLARIRRTKQYVITLLSNETVHVEYPMLYEAATASLPQESLQSTERITRSVSVSLANIVARLPLRIRTGKVEEIVPEKNLVRVSGGREVPYDFLVSALGADIATFGVMGVRENAFTVKTLRETLRLRHHIVRQFFLAARAGRKERLERLTFVVVGGGATGVETAAELAGQAHEQCLAHTIRPEDVRIVLLESGPRILSMLPQRLSAKATRRLCQLGVEVVTDSSVEIVTPDTVLWDGGKKRLRTLTVVWAGGLALHPVLARSTLPAGDTGILVKPTLQSIGFENVLGAGDGAVIEGREKDIPANVPVAYTQGALAARNILRLMTGKRLDTYTYRAQGQLIALGGKQALLTLASGRGWIGFLPWVVKRLVSLKYWLRFLPPKDALTFWTNGSRLQTWND